MEQIDTCPEKSTAPNPMLEEIKRILDPDDDFDRERINVEKYIVNMKTYYKMIISFDVSPELFFGIAREKNAKLTEYDAAKEDSDDGNLIVHET